MLIMKATSFRLVTCHLSDPLISFLHNLIVTHLRGLSYCRSYLSPAFLCIFNDQSQFILIYRFFCLRTFLRLTSSLFLEQFTHAAYTHFSCTSYVLRPVVGISNVRPDATSPHSNASIRDSNPFIYF